MDLEAELLREHSRRQADRIAAWAGSDRRRMEQLMRVFLTGEGVLAQRSAAAVNVVAEKYPGLVKRYLPRMVARMQEKGIHDAIRRSVVRFLQCADTPEALLGPVANACFGFLSAPDAGIAVKVFSMTILANIARKEPDLAAELRLVIEQQLPYASAGFRVRAREVLKAIHTEGRRHQ